MKILAADTSTHVNTVALSDGNCLLAEVWVASRRRHAERLLAAVDWVLEEAGLPLEDVDLFAVANGPGSFTGLRIGVATWKGLAFGCSKPLMPVDTLKAMALLGAARGGIIAPLLDARMREVFAAAYRCDRGGIIEAAPPAAMAPERFVQEVLAEIDAGGEGIFFLGDGAALYRERLAAMLPNARFANALEDGPRASAVALEAYALHQRGTVIDAAAVAPVYLRQAQAAMSKARSAPGWEGTP